MFEKADGEGMAPKQVGVSQLTKKAVITTRVAPAKDTTERATIEIR
jgi:hypothetical protein